MKDWYSVKNDTVKFREDLEEFEIPVFRVVLPEHPLVQKFEISLSWSEIEVVLERYLSVKDFEGTKLYNYGYKEFHCYIEKLHENGYSLIQLPTGEKLVVLSIDVE